MELSGIFVFESADDKLLSTRAIRREIFKRGIWNKLEPLGQCLVRDRFGLHQYRNITFWENKRRVERLTEFRAAVKTYFDDSGYRWTEEKGEYSWIEGEKAKEARQKINFMFNEICEIVHAAGVSTMIQSPSGDIKDILFNLFALEPNITPNHRLDLPDRAIGVYETDRRKSLGRTFNPFWWLVRMLTWLVHALTWFAGLLKQILGLAMRISLSAP